MSGKYTESLPIGRIRFTGTVLASPRELHIQMHAERGPSQLLFWLFEPTPPVSVLGGLMCGTSTMSATPDLSISRVIMIRMPAPNDVLATINAYLPLGASVASDLAAVGFADDVPDPVDEVVAKFLTSAGHDGFDQVTVDTYRPVVELFDRLWLARYRPESRQQDAAE